MTTAFGLLREVSAESNTVGTALAVIGLPWGATFRAEQSKYTERPDPIKRFLAGLTCEEDARDALRTEGVSSYDLPDAFPTVTPTTGRQSLSSRLRSPGLHRKCRRTSFRIPAFKGIHSTT